MASFIRAKDKDNKKVYINLDNVLYVSKNDLKVAGTMYHYVVFNDKRILNIKAGTVEEVKDLKEFIK